MENEWEGRRNEQIKKINVKRGKILQKQCQLCRNLSKCIVQQVEQVEKKIGFVPYGEIIYFSETKEREIEQRL